MQKYQTKDNIEHLEGNLQSLIDQLKELRSKNHELQIKIGELEILLQVNSLTSQTLDRDETLEAIKKLFLSKFNLDEYILMLKTDSEKELEIASYYGITLDKGVWVEVDEKNVILHEVFNKGESIYISDLTSDGHYNFLGLIGRKGSLLSLPLVSEKKTIIGILNLHRSEARAFSNDEIEFLQLMTLHAAGVIDKTILFQNTQVLAYTDALTSIFNRRYFDQRYTREILRARRYKRNLSVLMIDIDHFKIYNDTFGHLMGDKVLQKVAQVLETELRRADVICRYGGEEFVVILPEIDLHNAYYVAEKLRNAVITSTFSGDEKMAGKGITISLGVAAFPENGDTEKMVLEKADEALYKAKERGRNQVVVADVKQML